MFAKRMELIESSGIRVMFELAAKMKNPINFSLGQPDFDVPDNIKEAAIAAIRAGKNGYTSTAGVPPFKAAVKDSLRREGIACDDVLPVAGASGGLILGLMALADESTEVLYTDPGFVSYEHMVRLAGATPKVIDTYPDFRLTPAKLEAAVGPKSKVLIFNSPCNPTGITYTIDEIAALARTARRLGLQVIADEVYDQFCFDFAYESWLKHDPSALLVKSFSKTYGMPGWRAGYVAGSQGLVDQITKLQQFTYVCLHQPTQWACIEALKTDISGHVRDYRHKRDMVYEALKEYYNIVKPTGAFYIFPEAPGGNTEKLLQKCIEHELLIVPGKAFSKRNTHFRISYANSDAVLQRGIEILIKLARQT